MKSAQNNFCEFTSENPRVFYQPYPASGYGRLRRHARPAGAFFCCLIALGWLVDLGLSDTLGYPVGYSKSYDFSWFHDVSIEHHWTRPYWKYTPFSDTAIWVHYLGLTGGLTLKHTVIRNWGMLSHPTKDVNWKPWLLSRKGKQVILSFVTEQVSRDSNDEPLWDVWG